MSGNPWLFRSENKSRFLRKLVQFRSWMTCFSFLYRVCAFLTWHLASSWRMWRRVEPWSRMLWVVWYFPWRGRTWREVWPKFWKKRCAFLCEICMFELLNYDATFSWAGTKNCKVYSIHETRGRAMFPRNGKSWRALYRFQGTCWSM